MKIAKKPSTSLRHCQQGQAALVGVLILFILALGMYTTYSLGKAVNEKVRLQNIADVTAYSMAAAEARTFNFIAFTNRAQIADYISIMAIQAKISELTYYEGLVGAYSDLIYGLGCTIYMAGIITAIWDGGATKQVGKEVKAVGKLLNKLYEGIIGYRNQINLFDPFGAVLTWVSTFANWALWAAGWTLAVSTFSLVADCGHEFVTMNDPTLKKPPILSAIFGAYNAYRFNQAFDPVGGAPFPVSFDLGSEGLDFELSFPPKMVLKAFNASDDDPDLIRAQRVMTEMINASRGGEILLDRPFGANLERQLQDLLDSVEGSTEDIGDSKNAKKAKDIESQLPQDWAIKSGSSKLVTDENRGSTKSRSMDQLIKEMDRNIEGFSKLSRGTAMASYDNGMSILGRQRMYSIFAGVDQSWHCRYDRGDEKFEPSPPFQNIKGAWKATKALTTLVTGNGFLNCYNDNEKGKAREKLFGFGPRVNLHPWQGIAPYLKFNPKESSFGSGTYKDFNQPDVWIWLNRPPEDMTLTEAGDDLEFSVTQQGISASFRSGIADDRLHLQIDEGINAFARAQAYYHRPGSWQEHPNFFNPFWRARLAPTGDVLEALAGKIADIEVVGIIAKVLAEGLTDNIFTH